MAKEIYLGLEGIATLVLGAGMGVGRAIALWLARAGCDVAVVDVDAAAAERVAEEIRDEDGTAIVVPAGAVDGAAARSVVGAVAADLGALDLAVNVAPAPVPGGVVRGRAGAGVWPPWCRAEAAEMVARAQGGALLNVAFEADPAPGAGGPGAAARLTRRLARELAPHGIRVNAIVAPASSAALRPAAGGGPIGGGVEAGDVARAAVFLASDLARRISGQVLRVDAGAGLRPRPSRPRQ